MTVPEPASYRDREAQVFYEKGEVRRALSERATQEWMRLAATSFFGRLLGDGRVVATERLDTPPPDGFAAVLRHEKVPFVSYPYEWSFGMLKDAALLHLEILAEALSEQMILKDSTPYNVQWFGSRPAFIDISSFESAAPGEPWRAYRQFCEMFLNPLLVKAHRNLEFQPLLRGRLDGIPVAECSRLLTGRHRFRRGVLTHVWMHSKMEERYASSGVDSSAVLKDSGFALEMIRNNVAGLQNVVNRLEWADSDSTWANYEKTHTYGEEDRAWKEEFVRSASGRRRPRLVWDLGCNVGVFSRLVADAGAYVVAIDSDHLAIERLYRALKGGGDERILPLVMNLADPSPPMGWLATERRTLEGRGKPDMVLALALIHHLVIGANLPMTSVVDWLASLGADLVIEFVRRDDPMVRRLLVGKRDNYADYDESLFANLLVQRWQHVRREESRAGTRVLFEASRS